MLNARGLSISLSASARGSSPKSVIISVFEDLCRRILEKIGCQIAEKTRATGDADIDFWIK